MKKNKTNPKVNEQIFEQYKNRVRNLLYWFFSVLFLMTFITGVFLIPNVDEDKFCEERFNEHYPELKITKIDHDNKNDINGGLDNICEGKSAKVNITIENRDGLSLQQRGTEIQFKVHDGESIDYLNSDNKFWITYWIAFIISLVLTVSAMEWIGENL